MEQLRACYESYFAKAQKVWKERPAWDGMLGLGASTKDHPCHMEFYEAVEAWMEEFCRTEPENGSVFQAAEWIITAAAKKEGDPTYWFL